MEQQRAGSGREGWEYCQLTSQEGSGVHLYVYDQLHGEVPVQVSGERSWQQELARLGRDGWEVMHIDHDRAADFYLKRRIR